MIEDKEAPYHRQGYLRLLGCKNRLSLVYCDSSHLHTLILENLIEFYFANFMVKDETHYKRKMKLVLHYPC